MSLASAVTESSPSRQRTRTAGAVGTTTRPVAAIDLPSAVPASLAGVSPPMIEHMRPGDLLIDDAYQRDLSPKSLALVRRIVEGWDWLKFKAPIVAMTDRGFEVVDGQHTAIAAACHPDVETIPVLVVDGSDLQRRAAAFVSHAVDRLQARPAQVWHAAVAAGDEDATTIRDVLERASVTLLAYPPAHNVFGRAETVALGAVRRLVDGRGAERAREVLEILARADLAPITADHIRVADALLCDPDYAGALNAERIAAVIRDVTPKQLSDAKGLAYRARMPAWRALAAVLSRASAPPKRGRTKSAEAMARKVTPSPVLTEPTKHAPSPAGPRETIHLPDIGPITTAALSAGVEHWRQGGPWPRIWGAVPGDPACVVPASFLGEVATIAGCRRWAVVIERTIALWRQNGAWPDGWGPAPDHPDCAVPKRFRGTSKPA